MNDIEFHNYRLDLEKECDRVLHDRGPAYAGEGGDRLANFRLIAKLLDNFSINLSAEDGVWAVYFLKHVFSILAYIGQRTEGDEKIKGRIVDARNYLDLFYGMVGDLDKRTAGRILFIDAKRPPQPHHSADQCTRSWCKTHSAENPPLLPTVAAESEQAAPETVPEPAPEPREEVLPPGYIAGKPCPVCNVTCAFPSVHPWRCCGCYERWYQPEAFRSVEADLYDQQRPVVYPDDEDR